VKLCARSLEESIRQDAPAHAGDAPCRPLVAGAGGNQAYNGHAGGARATTSVLVCRMTCRIDDGLTILIVEDRAVVGAAIADVLTDAGYRVIGPVGSTADALAAIADTRIDAALLDIHLGGDHRVFEVAEVLLALRVPFSFLSATSRRLLPPKFSGRPFLEKPLQSAEVLAALEAMLPTPQ
jgi:CheY-like chemotaxis protein